MARTWVLPALIVACGLELISWTMLRLTEGAWFSYSDLRKARQSAVANAPDAEQEPATEADGEERETFSGSGRDVLHPFVGFVLDRDFAVDRRQAIAGKDGLEYGFNLGGDLFGEPKPGRVVVAVTGGSVAHRFALRHADVLKGHLMELRPDITDVVVLNLALPGYKEPQQLMVATWILSLGAHFDAIVNIDGFNDIALAGTHNVSRGVFPFFPRDWDLRVRPLDPDTRRIAGELEVIRTDRADLAHALGWGPLRYSMTASFIWERLDRKEQARAAHLEASLLEKRNSDVESYQSTGPHREYDTDDALIVDLVENWKRGSYLLDRLCRGLGCVYTHFLQPNQYVPSSKILSAEEERIAFKPDRVQAVAVGKAYPQLRKAGEALRGDGVRFTDLTWLFAGEAGTIYVDPCCHFNERGNVLLGEAIAAELAETLPKAQNN